MRLPPAGGNPAETDGLAESIRVFLRAKRWGWPAGFGFGVGFCERPGGDQYVGIDARRRCSLSIRS
jgi:hypothetical protein